MARRTSKSGGGQPALSREVAEFFSDFWPGLRSAVRNTLQQYYQTRNHLSTMAAVDTGSLDPEESTRQPSILKRSTTRAPRNARDCLSGKTSRSMDAILRHSPGKGFQLGSRASAKGFGPSCCEGHIHGQRSAAPPVYRGV